LLPKALEKYQAVYARLEQLTRAGEAHREAEMFSSVFTAFSHRDDQLEISKLVIELCGIVLPLQFHTVSLSGEIALGEARETQLEFLSAALNPVEGMLFYLRSVSQLAVLFVNALLAPLLEGLAEWERLPEYFNQIPCVDTSFLGLLRPQLILLERLIDQEAEHVLGHGASSKLLEVLLDPSGDKPYAAYRLARLLWSPDQRECDRVKGILSRLQNVACRHDYVASVPVRLTIEFGWAAFNDALSADGRAPLRLVHAANAMLWLFAELIHLAPAFRRHNELHRSIKDLATQGAIPLVRFCHFDWIVDSYWLFLQELRQYLVQSQLPFSDHMGLEKAASVWDEATVKLLEYILAETRALMSPAHRYRPDRMSAESASKAWQMVEDLCSKKKIREDLCAEFLAQKPTIIRERRMTE